MKSTKTSENKMHCVAFSVSNYNTFDQNHISSFMKQTSAFQYERRIQINLLIIISTNL